MASSVVVNSVHVFPLIDKEADERPTGRGSDDGPDCSQISTPVTREGGVWNSFVRAETIVLIRVQVENVV